MAKGPSKRTLSMIFGVLLALGACVLGCDANLEVNPNEKSGNDGERGRAQLIELNTPVNDNLDRAESDMTDWKYFQIPAPGRIRVTLGCDIAGASCVAVVRDEMGASIRRIESNGEPRVQDTVPVSRGNYYLEVYVQASATDYTIQIDYEPN